MSGFVLVRREDGKYVARPGSEHSYTRTLEKARIYPTRQAAMADKCGNEDVREVNTLFKN